MGFGRGEMREIELEREGAGLFRDNDEKIDPDKDFPHIDKRIQNALGHYQKDFMGEISAEILGSKFGGYGSFLPVDWNSPVPTLTRSQSHFSSRSPHNRTTEVRQNSAVQINEFVPGRPRPGIPPLARPEASASDFAADVGGSGEAFHRKQPKTFPADRSDNSVRNVRAKVGTENVIDNSAIYSGLGLDISPSSSSLGDSPLDLDGTSPYVQGLPEESPSHIIKVMTSIPVPDGGLLSPLSDNLLSLMEKEVNLGGNSRLQTSMKAEQESITSEGIMSIISEQRVKQMNKNKVSVSEMENFEDSTIIADQCLKRMEGTRVSKGKELVLENSVSAIDGPSDRKDTSTIVRKDKIANTPFKFDERIKVEEGVDVVPKLQKQSHVSQGKSIEKMDFAASPVASSDEKGNPIKSIQKVQRDNDVKSVTRDGVDNGGLSQTGYLEQKSIKSEEQIAKKKVERELHESFSPQGAGMLHQLDRITEEDTDKFTRRQKKLNNKVKALPDSACVEAGTYHERTDLEMTHNGSKDSFAVVKDVGSKQKNRTEDRFQGMKDLDGATVESRNGGSGEKNLPHSRMGANLHNKDPLSSEGKKKVRKNHDGSQLTAVPKVSFKVSSAASSHQTNHGGNLVSQGETQKKARKVKEKVGSVAGKASFRKREKVEAEKGSIVGLAKREKHAPGIKVEDNLDVTGFQYPSDAGSIPREDTMNSSHMMEKAPTSATFPTEIAPVVIEDNWVQCDKCQTWRLLPHNINPDDLPKRWLCSMLDWLPGMNDCRFTEAETQAALLALYQPLPVVNDAKIRETYPNVGPSAVAPDTHTNPAAGLDAPLGSGKRRTSQVNRAKPRQDQLYSVQSGDKRKVSQSRIGAGKPVVIGMKRGGSKDMDPVPKKMKRDSQQFAKDLDPVAPSSIETANDNVGMGNSNAFEKLKDNNQKPADTTEDYRNDVSAKKRKLKDRHKGTVGTETPSWQVLSKESSTDTREEKRQTSRYLGKESSTTRTDDKKGGNRHNGSHSGSLPRAGRREGKRSEQQHARSTSQNSVDGKKLSRLDPELKMPALVAATSSSSKVSSTSRFKLKSQAKASPVGSISSSPLKVSRSNHDRSRNQISTLTEQELSSGKKNLEARIVAPESVPDYGEKMKGKSKKEADLQSQFCPAQEETVKKTSAGKHVDGDRSATLPKFEAYESKQLGIKVKAEESSSHRVFTSDDQHVGCLNVKSLDKPKLDNVAPERVKSKQDQAGSSSRHNTYSRTQELGFEEGKGCNSMVTHDGKGKLPKRLEGGESVVYDAGASSSVGKDNYDWATTIKEAKDLKHSAARMEDIRLGLRMSFEAALKFLHGASLLESGNAEGSRSGDLKPSDVYSSTAALCHYCAREFEKFDDMACAALAYKCMEVAYMRVVYAHDMEANKDRRALQQSVQRAVPQVESPSSSASDVDNVNNPTSNDAVKATQSLAVRGNHVISAGNRPRFVRLLDFVQNVNVAVSAATKSQSAFTAARLTLGEAGNVEAISSIKRVLDFSFHDMDELLLLVRLAMEFFTVD